MQRKVPAGRRQPHSLRPRPQSSGKGSALRRFGQFLGRHKKLVASGVVALVVAAGVQFREAIFPELFPQEKLGDEVRALQGQQPLQIVRVTRVGDPNGGHKFVRPDGYTFQGAEADAVQDLSQERGRGVLDQVEKTGGVPVGESLWQILLHGNSKQGIQILGMTPVVVRRTEPAAGTLVYLPAQGVDDSTYMSVNGDETEPVVRTSSLSPDDGERVFAEPYFTTKTIHLDDREDQVVMLDVVAKKSDVSFRLDVDYQVGDQRLRATLDDNGEPFRVTGLRCPGGAPAYGAYYSVTSSAAGHLGVGPADAASMSYVCRD